ncbi:MAG TPA: hypothetical protein PLK54_11940 [Ferruginibacter sp.]|nr:hypothetical protein [Ferruginibacter sp.]MBN8699235.1 hypothetical protein [Chitinophagales bacterium]HMU71193.1 hypothetical protein [Ferruginibacter sp.]HMW27421.1 hypothetical protein [Ferruginibacter sp.]HMX38001.1 hypothetical protein [Ferruginibacter sp.]
MSRTTAQKISIYLKIDSNSIHAYFNPHDPARLDKRQLGHDFQEYLDNSIATAGRNTHIDFKVFCCDTDNMRFMVEPLMKTIRRHFQKRKMLKEAEFRKFKRRNYILLMMSIMVVMFCQGVIPLIFGQDHRIHSMFSNAIDVFSWVILWKPIERLIFYWNPFLKEILLYEKMQHAKVNIVESEEALINYHLEHYDAA